jgi:hypothetical protein
MQPTEVLEGVLEEIAAQHPELRHRRVRVIVLPEPTELTEPKQEQTLYERLKPFIGSVKLEGSPGADKVSEVVGDLIVDKMMQERKNGDL